MKNVKHLSVALLLAFVCAPAAAHAGERDQRIISARAGGVNLVEGDVRVRRAGSDEWLALSTADELKRGDAVRTGSPGRVEVLLNPGSYLRAGAGTEFTLAETDLNGLRVELARGSAVVEAMGYADTDLSIEVSTPRALARVIRTGVYRVNALAEGGAEVAVFEGRALVGGTLVKGGKRARATAGGVEVAKFDRKNERDELDLWSRERGKELARANVKLQRRDVNSLLARGGFDSYFNAASGPYYGTGFWYFDSRRRCYTFLPYGAGWRSPYGYWYDTGIAFYPSRWPARGQRDPNQGYPQTNGGGGGVVTGGGSAPSPTPSGSGVTRGGWTPPARAPQGGGPGRMPSNPRMEKNPNDGQPRRDNW